MSLSSLERVKIAINHMDPGVIPVGPFMGNHGAHVAGYKLFDYLTNGKNMADAQYKAWEIYGQDIVVAQSDNYYIAQGFGSEVDFYEDSTPTLRKPALSNILEVGKLKVPDPYKDGRMPVYLEAIERLSHKLGGQVCIRGTGTGPFSLASHLLGTQDFLMNIAEADCCGETDVEKAIFELMSITTEALIAFCKAELEAGADIVQCGDSLASMDMISPAIYRKYVYPFEKKFFEAMKPYKEKNNGFTLLHICGNNTKIMELLADTGTDILEVDSKIDLAYYKESIGNKVCLMGNLNPTEALLMGTVEKVEQEAMECIKKAAMGGGFILGSGCEVPIHAPQENIKAMIKAAREYRARAGSDEK